MKHELRLNNYVLYDNRPFQIASISEEYPSLKTIEFGIGVVDWNNISPIPLTEELLVKNCKFTKINERLFVKGRLLVCIHQDMATFTDDNTTIRFKGLHHLQNVFYYKHDTELTYDQDNHSAGG
jgi:hypothetical protein